MKDTVLYQLIVVITCILLSLPAIGKGLGETYIIRVKVITESSLKPVMDINGKNITANTDGSFDAVFSWQSTDRFRFRPFKRMYINNKANKFLILNINDIEVQLKSKWRKYGKRKPKIKKNEVRVINVFV